MKSTLITNARLPGRRALLDLRIEGESIGTLAAKIPPRDGDVVIDAAGDALLPGLHDHHIHLVSLAASLDSLQCGPPAVRSEAELARLLRTKNAEAGGAWLRGIGYHPCVAGDIDRDWLDVHIPDRPARIQHRGGRLWVLNSRALGLLGASEGDAPPGLEHAYGRPSGRLYEGDRWLRSRLDSHLPDLAAASVQLAACGITGITDTTPHNGPAEWAHFRESHARGSLLQRVRMMGAGAIGDCEETALLRRGEFKVHLLESQLPDLDSLCADIASAHRGGRAVAIHCVTLTELVFALSALQTAGCVPGDRIEHASVTPPQQLELIRELGLRVVTQPNFVSERGDQYLADVNPADRPWLYRCAGFLDAGVPLAAGSDAPFGGCDPWLAMRAAVSRRTPSGTVMQAGERLQPDQALALFLSDPATPGLGARSLEAGQPADLCLLNQPWERAREMLDSSLVRMTWRSGSLIHEAT